jgi:hypothetical protein
VGRPLFLALTAIFVIQVGVGDWFGGWCFGPRYLTDLLPFLTWFLLPLWTGIWARRVLRWRSPRRWPPPCGCKSSALSITQQEIGTFWPVDVDLKPQRLWDWSDNQILRSWNAGPVAHTLLDEWLSLRQNRSGVL